MMRKNNNNRNNNNNMKHRSGGNGGGQRRYNNNGGGGNRSGGNDSGNIVRQKQHATSQREKYSNMARDAQINGDRVDVEYYLQHVDHYTRVLTDIAAIEAERYAQQRESQIVPGGPNDPNAAAFHAQQQEQQQSQNQTGDAPQSDAAPAESSEMPIEHQAHQPRMTRQRRPYNPPADDNGAREANSNQDDIPLPGSILPPI